MSETREEFAEEVRRECVRILRALQHGRTEEASNIAAWLCERSATIVQQAKMKAEVEEPERYDLATLPPIEES